MTKVNNLCDMDMKRMLFLLMMGLCVWTGMAQSTDLMRVYTDKECYLAGEELWIKVSSDDKALPGNSMSRVAYVEICDTAQVYAQGKVALHQGAGWACIRLPQTMHTGVYQLVAYTRYMRNLEPDCYPRKYVAVLNTLGASDKDNRKMMDIRDIPEEVSASISSKTELKGDKKVYGLREKVSLSWPSRLAEAKELVLSVARKDCALNLAQPKSGMPVRVKNGRWLPECEGHIVTAKIKEGELPETAFTQLSCVGKEMKMFEGKKMDDNIYQFYTYGVNGQQDLVLAAFTGDGKPYRMELETPFIESLPDAVPDLVCHYEDSDLIDRSVAMQLSQIMPEVVMPEEAEETIFSWMPDKTYNLDEYVRFNIVEECIVEFVMGVSIDKVGGRKVIRMLNKNDKGFNFFPVLVLVDGVAFNDHSDVLAYNAHRVQYIHQYRSNFALGENFYGGILSLVTHRGMLADMRMDERMQMLAYEFPQDRPAFKMPLYPDEESRLSRRPDFRHTMYWEPMAEGKTGTEFYTSDLEGNYVAVLQGIDADGKRIEMKWEFQVK